jgi:hypothetical protein
VKLPNNQDQKLKYFYGCKQHPAWRDPCQLVQEPGETITILLASANVSPLEGPVVAPPSLTDPAQASPEKGQTIIDASVAALLKDVADFSAEVLPEV